MLEGALLELRLRDPVELYVWPLSIFTGLAVHSP